MAELFKNIYTRDFFENYCRVLGIVVSNFDESAFLSEIFDSEWESLEIKQRMRHISNVLKSYLSSNYTESVNQLLQTISILESEDESVGVVKGRMEYIFISDYIEQNGIDDFEISVSAFEKITQFTSSEFAVRPFIIKYEQKMLDRMLVWTDHKNENVRRLASEGSRSRLPWAMAIPVLKKDASPVLPILEKLKADPSEYVRKSVANNLNDISKDNPQTVIEITKRWKGKSKETDWIVKHACRSLLKDGNIEVLQIFGFGSVDKIEIKNLRLASEIVKIGDYLQFTFEIYNKSKKKEKIRLEYGIYYQKKNASLSKKVYKISEKEYAEKSVTIIDRRQAFKLITTRKFHLGAHKLSLIINGVETDPIEFELREN
jgi:3-methyladenine DNA glycosylase AlkC